MHQERLKRKLENLQSFQMAKAYSSNKTVVNLSGKCLSENDMSALNRGFTMSWPQKMNSIEIKTNHQCVMCN